MATPMSTTGKQAAADRRAASLRAMRRAISAAPLPTLSPNSVGAFAVGVHTEEALLLRITEDHDDLSDPLLSRQTAIIRNTVIDLARSLLKDGRRTERELAYPDDADGGARLLRDEVLAALGSRAKMLGPDPD